MISKYAACLLFAYLTQIEASTTPATPLPTTSSWWDTDYPKAVITLAVLAGALIIGIAIAKLAEWFYKRNSVRDDASDISEHTKELLRKQLALLSMRKNRKALHSGQLKDHENPEIDQKAKTSKILKTWMNKAKRSRTKSENNTITATVIVNNNAAVFDSANSPPSRPKTRISFSDEQKKYNDAQQQWDDVNEITADVSPVPLAEGSEGNKKQLVNGSAGKRSESPVKRSASPKKRPSLKSVSEAQASAKNTKGSLTSEEFEFIDETLKAMDDKKPEGKPVKNKSPASPKSRTPSPKKRTTSPPKKDSEVAPKKSDTITPNPVIKNDAIKSKPANRASPTAPPGLEPKPPLNKTVAADDNGQDSVAYSRYSVPSPRSDNNKTIPRPVSAWKPEQGSQPSTSDSAAKKSTSTIVKDTKANSGNHASPPPATSSKTRPQTGASTSTGKTKSADDKARPVTASTRVVATNHQSKDSNSTKKQTTPTKTAYSDRPTAKSAK
ncbi:uncharacterized protein LOC141901557 [Tubulanus polymorphus]|uniref:uncharacterized protein LOC141901557 n=1 Tax=Tubulanus polymorphus TaxID=672921 RepID=UPI003DA2C410